MADILPPGRELDRRVAEVLHPGWDYWQTSDGSWLGEDRKPVAAYSTDPTANREVREWITSRRPDVTLTWSEKEWEVDYGLVDHESLCGSTLEHALCLAALRVAEEERAAKAEAESLTAAGFRHGTPADFMATGESVVAQLNRLTDERDEARQQADRLQAELKRVQAERDDYAERIERVAEAIAGE